MYIQISKSRNWNEINERNRTYFQGMWKIELIIGHKSSKNIKLYEKLGYKIFKTEKLTENLSLVYLEKINL